MNSRSGSAGLGGSQDWENTSTASAASRTIYGTSGGGRGGATSTLAGAGRTPIAGGGAGDTKVMPDLTTGGGLGGTSSPPASAGDGNSRPLATGSGPNGSGGIPTSSGGANVVSSVGAAGNGGTSLLSVVSTTKLSAGDSGLAGGSATDPVIRHTELVDVSGGVVELRTNVGYCTATLINNNSLLTAARCGDFERSYAGNVKVLYQHSATTWSCLTNAGATGKRIEGAHDYVAGACAGREADFNSMFDNGTDSIIRPGSAAGQTYTIRKHDLAVVTIRDAGFEWLELNDVHFAALYADTIRNGWKWGYGMGRFSNNLSLDHRVRRDEYNVGYSDEFVVGTFGTTVQLCSGDSGGPIGEFLVMSPSLSALPPIQKFALIGVASIIAETGELCGDLSADAYWSNVTTRIAFVEDAIGKACRRVDYGGVMAAECWD